MKKEKLKVLTAAMVSDHLESDGDFRKFGNYVIEELIFLAHRQIYHEVNLGKGVFKSPFLCFYSYFNKSFNCNDSVFESDMVFKDSCCYELIGPR
jgi:hypothetical protein